MSILVCAGLWMAPGGCRSSGGSGSSGGQTGGADTETTSTTTTSPQWTTDSQGGTRCEDNDDCPPGEACAMEPWLDHYCLPALCRDDSECESGVCCPSNEWDTGEGDYVLACLECRTDEDCGAGGLCDRCSCSHYALGDCITSDDFANCYEYCDSVGEFCAWGICDENTAYYYPPGSDCADPADFGSAHDCYQPLQTTPESPLARCCCGTHS